MPTLTAAAAALLVSLPILACPDPGPTTPTAVAEPPPALACEGGGAGVILGDVVNVRAGPGTAYDVVGQLAGGAGVTILGEAFGWLLVRPSAAFAVYVSREFVEPKGDGVAVVTRDRVNIRSKAALNGTVLGQVNRGDLLRLLDAGGDFVAIAAPPEVGFYVHRDLVRRVDLTVEAGIAPSALSEPGSTAPAEAPPAPNLTASEKALRARDLYLAELDKADLDVMDFGPARRLYEEAAREATDPAVRGLVHAGLKRLSVAAQLQADYRRRIAPIERFQRVGPSSGRPD